MSGGQNSCNIIFAFEARSASPTFGGGGTAPAEDAAAATVASPAPVAAPSFGREAAEREQLEVQCSEQALAAVNNIIRDTEHL